MLYPCSEFTFTDYVSLLLNKHTFSCSFHKPFFTVHYTWQGQPILCNLPYMISRTTCRYTSSFDENTLTYSLHTWTCPPSSRPATALLSRTSCSPSDMTSTLALAVCRWRYWCYASKNVLAQIDVCFVTSRLDNRVATENTTRHLGLFCVYLKKNPFRNILQQF